MSDHRGPRTSRWRVAPVLVVALAALAGSCGDENQTQIRLLVDVEHGLLQTPGGENPTPLESIVVSVERVAGGQFFAERTYTMFGPLTLEGTCPAGVRCVPGEIPIVPSAQEEAGAVRITVTGKLRNSGNAVTQFSEVSFVPEQTVWVGMRLTQACVRPCDMAQGAPQGRCRYVPCDTATNVVVSTTRPSFPSSPPPDGGMPDAPPPDTMAPPPDTTPPPQDTGMPGACASDMDCAAGCPAGAAMGCTCVENPMLGRRNCVPRCSADADCPRPPMGSLRCDTRMRICVPS